MSGPKGRTSGVIAQWFEGCFVRLGIDRRVFQKVADVQSFYPHKGMRIRTSNFHFIKCSLQPIELSLEDKCLILLYCHLITSFDPTVT